MKIGAALHRLARRPFGHWLWIETYRCMRLRWNEAQDAAVALADASPGIEVRQLQRAELERYSKQVEYDFSPRFLEGLAPRDDLCFGAFSGAQLVSYCFFAIMPTAIDADLRFHFPARWIYAYKAHTHPSWRGRRLLQQVLLRALPEMRVWLSDPRAPAGFVTLVMRHNPASFSAFRRLGFTPFESFSVLRIRTRPRLVSPSKDEARDFHIELTAKD